MDDNIYTYLRIEHYSAHPEVRAAADTLVEHATATADLNIDGKNAFQALGPGHRRVTLSR